MPPVLAPRTPANVPSRVWRGTSLLVFGRLWGSFCTFVTLVLLAARLPPDAFGRYTFYLAVFVLLDSLADFGTGQIAVQRTASDESAVASVLAATRRIRFVTGSLGVALVGGGALWFDEPGAGWLLVASLYPLTHVFELSTTVFKNRIAWGIPVAVRAVASALSLSFVLILLARGDTEPAHYVCAVAAGSAIANGLLHWAARKHLPSAKPASIPFQELFWAALPLGIASLCQQAYFYVDNLFVRALCGAEAVGQYNLGVRILSYSIMVAIYSSQAALPWLAREHARGELGNALARLTQPLLAVAAFGAGLVAPWSAQLLSLFGGHFAEAGPSLRWLLGATAVIYAGAGLMTALVAAGRSRSILAIALVALGANVALNAWAVPRFGIEGAAAVTLATEIAVVIGAAIALARAGVRLRARAAGWLGGPIAFAVGWWLSSKLPIS
jgi:O-antigen/teichoic acid export membrane protein